jgi:hypothetical protein
MCNEYGMAYYVNHNTYGNVFTPVLKITPVLKNQVVYYNSNEVSCEEYEKKHLINKK